MNLAELTNRGKNMQLSNGKIILGKVVAILAIVFGSPWCLFWGIGILAVFTPHEWESVPFVIACLILLSVSVLFVVYGVKKLRFISRCRKYTSILSAKSVASVEKLADVAGHSPELVRATLNRMVSRNYLSGLYVDNSTGEIVFIEDVRIKTLRQQDMEAGKDVVRIQCPNCGGTTQLHASDSGICDYCGARLSR